MQLKYIKFLKFSFFFNLLITAIALFPCSNLYALESSQNTPKVNFGAGGSFGVYHVNSIGGEDHMDWDPGLGYGGGIVFESMFSNTFGLHSGLWFIYYSSELYFSDKDSGSDEEIKHTVKTKMLTLPVYLISSLDSRFVTFNLLTGLNFSYIAESFMKPTPDGGEGSGNIKKYLGYGQIGAGAGIEFLFKISKFTRLFLSFAGEYYFINLIQDNEGGQIDHLYNVNLRAGIMLCTF
ncbi:MAG: outer membrane beta-barrel protein [Spirochaetes bacterium]|nr:outer membrane beta-barrel protein [Spirochaetota bacterium]